MIVIYWYVVMLLISAASSFFGLPFLIATTAVGFGTNIGFHPILIGFIVSVGAGIGSLLNQLFGQCYFKVKEPKNSHNPRHNGLWNWMMKINDKFKNWMLKIIEKYKKYTLFLVILGTLTPLPEAAVLATIGKDYPKLKMFLITLIVRVANFSAIAWIGGSWVKELIHIAKA